MSFGLFLSCFESKNEIFELTSPKPGFAGSTENFMSDMERASYFQFHP